jgi:hypothetical protein
MMREVRRTLLAAASVAVLAAVAVTACDGGDDDNGGTTPASGAPPAATSVPRPPSGDGARLTMLGQLTRDGQLFDAEFLGVRVVREGRVTPCQATLPPVEGGSYQIEVLLDADVRGCGAPGAAVLLWVFADGGFLYATETAPWPEDLAPLPFNADFSTVDPAGASMPVTEIKGRLYDAAGAQLPDGAVVEAYIGDTICGTTTLRDSAATEGYYTLIIAGPESVSGCAEGAAIAFRVNDAPADGTAVNDLGRGGAEQEADLTLR